MAKTIDELKSAAAEVRDATEEKENTALRVGQLLVDMIDLLGMGITPFLVNNLTQGGSTKALTAEQGKVLKALIDSKAFPIINDLITGGISSALSAEQGKVLKQIVDRLSEINIDGITGFVPISSLNDLPASPTSEQKGKAYILDNALYIYVGNNGNTLDGKYQSTPLVTLDWNDKAYAPSIYNGLGRNTLKKNMFEGVNMLTSAMVSIANTEYFIQYDYDLCGGKVTLPANASLVFMGGSIKNGTLIGNNTRIQAKKGVCIFDNITIQGTWNVDTAYSSWFWMHKKGYKIASVTEGSKTLYKGTDKVYYELADLTIVGSEYYVTSTLVEGAVVEGSIKVSGTTYATFKVDGDETDYIAAPPTIPGSFDSSAYAQYDDTKALQSLLDLRAKRTIVEDGVYIIKADTNYNNNRYNGLYVDGHKDSELVLEGWLKVLPNNRNGFYALDVIGCDNFKISGKGGVHGDLLEHIGEGGEGGMNIAVASTRNFVVESITTAYAWGDCIYSHWWTNGRADTIVGHNKLQEYHSYKNVKIIYGGRTGYACELANNVVFDGCYFYGSGRVRGKHTNSAVDIEPFNYSDTPQRYVKNYEFKNNVFENSGNGIRLERCVNCSVHDNEFDFGWCGVLVIWHKDVSYDITGPTDRGWVKSYMKIYNNFIRRCSRGVYITSTDVGDRKYSDNIEIYGNTLVSCSATFLVESLLKNSRVFNNVTYGCGQWNFGGAIIDCDIYNNRCYGCVMPELTSGWGAGRILVFLAGVFDNCKRSTFHHNHFSIDYGVSLYGLGESGKEQFFHGLPNGLRYSSVEGVNLSAPEKVYFFDNVLSDEFTLNYGPSSDYQDSVYFKGGLGSTKNEESEVFLENDIFKSKTYGDEGVVTKGGMVSNSWLNNARVFEPYMEVVYGEIIKLGDYFKVCNRGGTCGETLTVYQGECGSARFTETPAIAATEHSASRIKIRFTKSGFCTSDSRPTIFLYEGRKMHETDTGRDIIYNGTTWVYENYVPKIEVVGTTPIQVLAPNTYYQFADALTSLNLSLGAHDGVTFFAGRFSTDKSGCELTLATSITLESGAPTVVGGKTYEFNIIDNIMMLKEI